MSPATSFVIPEHVVARMVGGETVILDLASGTYFGLDPVGTRLWQLLESGQTLRDLCDTLTNEFDVARETLEQDVLDLVEELSKKNLINAADSAT